MGFKPIRNSLFRPFAITFCDGDLAEASIRAAYIAGDLNPQSLLNPWTFVGHQELNEEALCWGNKRGGLNPQVRGSFTLALHWYRGRTLVVPTDKGLTAVNWVDDEEYLYSVVGGEMDTEWTAEALKAQAVAARTFALYEREKQRNNPVYDLGDSPDHWQNYKGVINESPSTYAAVDATDKQVLTSGWGFYPCFFIQIV